MKLILRKTKEEVKADNKTLYQIVSECARKGEFVTIGELHPPTKKHPHGIMKASVNNTGGSIPSWEYLFTSLIDAIWVEEEDTVG